MMYGRGFNDGYGMMGGGWLGGLGVLFFGALVIAGVVLLVIWAMRSSRGHGGGSNVAPGSGPIGHDEAVAIAKRRLANGEIDKDEYERIMSALGG